MTKNEIRKFAFQLNGQYNKDLENLKNLRILYPKDRVGVCRNRFASNRRMEDGEMSKPHGIIVFGVNGVGKTTLGRELARILNYKHMDIEAYAFRETEIPYTDQRSNEECIALMLADIKKYRSFVISAVTGDFGDTIPLFYELAILISAPVETRIRRIEQRAYERHGARVREGGDMYEQNLKFIDFAASRSLAKIEQWAGTLTCPVIRIDGTVDWCANAVNIINQFYNKD